VYFFSITVYKILAEKSCSHKGCHDKLSKRDQITYCRKDLAGGIEVPLSPLEVELLLISKYKKSQIDWLRNGIRIEQVAGQTIGDLVLQASAARHSLAGHFLRSAAMFLKLKPGRHRDGISRSYYSQDNDSFRRWLTDTIFGMTYEE
jgi:hypothetical protein